LGPRECLTIDRDQRGVYARRRVVRERHLLARSLL
jgi:hypothetical protein